MTAKGNDRKLLLILGCVVVVLCLVVVGWHLTVERGDYKPNPIRPDDAASHLAACEDTFEELFDIAKQSGAALRKLFDWRNPCYEEDLE